MLTGDGTSVAGYTGARVHCASRHTPLLPVAGLVFALVSLALPAMAYDFEVASRTEGYGYQLRRLDRDGVTFLNRRRLTQYLGLRLFNLLDPGQLGFSPGSTRPPALLTFQLMMRFDADFGGFMEHGGTIDELGNNQFDLLFGSLEGRNLWGVLDLSLGRQYQFELFDIFAFDGLRVRTNLPHGVFAELFAGVQLARAHPLSRAVFELDGTSGDGTDDAWSPTFGVAVGLDDLAGLDVRLSYRGTASFAPLRKDGDEVWAMDQELLFASLEWEVPVLGTRPGLALRYSLVTGELDDLSATLGQMFLNRHQLWVEYLRSLPHFDGDSIFNLFDTEPYHEVALRYALRLFEDLHAHIRFGYRSYWSSEDEGEQAEDDTRAFSAALGAGWRQRRLSMGLDLFVLDGYGGRTLGGDLDATWQLLRRLALEGRVSLIDYRGSGLVGSDGLAFGAQVGARITFFPGVVGHLLAEDNVRSGFKSALRLLGVLDLELKP